MVVLKDFRAAGSLRELFEITLGMVRVKINHFAGKPNPYRMNSPTASIAVRGTEFSIAVDAAGRLRRWRCIEGAVEVASLTDPDRRVLIEAGPRRAGAGRTGFPPHRRQPGQPGNRDAGDRNGQAEKAEPANRPLPGIPTLRRHTRQAAPLRLRLKRRLRKPRPALRRLSALPLAPQAPVPQADGGAQPHPDRDDSPRATASTYDRYLAGLADIAQVPFLFRFNAFPEAHLDSLENPAYATEFHSAEGRVFILPTFRGAQHSSGVPIGLRPGGSLPGDYSVSPQVSFFAPAGGFTFGGSASVSRVGNTTLTAMPDYSPGTLQPNPQYSPPTGGSQTSGSSSDTFYSGALVAARRFGANSFGLELATLKGTGSIASLTTGADGPGRLSQEESQSTSDISQTRITAGFSRDLSRNVKLGLFYRYAFIRADDQDISHTLNGLPAGLNATRTGGHSSEFGMRLRGLATRRLSYGFAAAWLGISLLDGMNRITAVDSHERDRAKRGSVAIGLGYALTRSTTLSFDLAGGTARTWASRTEDDSGALLQNALNDTRFVSAHAAVQSDITRRLFLTASFLNIWQTHNLNVNVYPDRFGNTVSVEDSFFPMTPNPAQYVPRFSDFGAGWRFTRNLFAQYIYSTDYGVTSGTHTLMLRYTFHLRD